MWEARQPQNLLSLTSRGRCAGGTKKSQNTASHGSSFLHNVPSSILLNTLKILQPTLVMGRGSETPRVNLSFSGRVLKIANTPCMSTLGVITFPECSRYTSMAGSRSWLHSGGSGHSEKPHRDTDWRGGRRRQLRCPVQSPPGLSVQTSGSAC